MYSDVAVFKSSQKQCREEDPEEELTPKSVALRLGTRSSMQIIETNSYKIVEQSCHITHIIFTSFEDTTEIHSHEDIKFVTVLCSLALASAGQVREKRGFLSGLHSYAPAVSYSAPAVSYASYSAAPSYSYSAAPSYSYSAAPAVSYSAPAVSYSAPAVSYSAPAVSYSTPAISYSAPAVSYSAPAVSYASYSAAPSYSYSAPAVSYAPRLVAVKRVVNVNKVVSVPQVVKVNKLVSVPQVVVEKKLVSAPSYAPAYSSPQW
ncbi:unnamed protein product [Plutella xylostella]|uniref:(diamondback moth) hypothetical protein n=1 Tax=Plutella xylostella TaxID=51655 RepID=A0A8S4F7R1_PLUXY|nr:unnamed protein product [Plutella xylostella]